MNTKAFDAATLIKALTQVEQATGTNGWACHPAFRDTQEFFLNAHRFYADQVERLDHMTAMASDCADDLNKVLTDNGFPAMFQDLGERGVGAVAILDMLVEWVTKAEITEVQSLVDTNGYRSFKGFKLPIKAASIYTIPGHNQPLIRLHTKSGASAWIIVSSPPEHPLELLNMARRVLKSRLLIDSSEKHHSVEDMYDSVVVPSLEVDTKVQLDWLLGMRSGRMTIEQAFQLLKIRMNEEGARVRVASGVGTLESCFVGPEPLVVDQPFLLFFTQDDTENDVVGDEVPIAALYADHGCWQSWSTGQ